MKIKAAIVGSGIGLRHFEAIQNYKGSIVKVICESNKSKIKILKKKFPNVQITSNFRDVIKNQDINLLSIASYDQFHYHQIIAGIKNQKNLIIEKPMCLNISQLKKIRSCLKKEKKINIISNLVLRTEPIFKYIKKNIDKNNLFYIEADYIWGRLYKLTDDWRAKVKNYSLISGTAIHMIDLVMWFLNDRPKKVLAIGNKILTRKSKFKKESFVVCILEFSKDIIVKITANSTNDYEHMHEVKIFQKHKTIIQSKDGLEVITQSKGKIIKRKLNLRYPLKKNRKQLIRSFIDNILKKKEPMVSLKEQFDLMSVCFALNKSLKISKKIDVEYL